MLVGLIYSLSAVLLITMKDFNKQLFPTPESPMRINFKEKSSAETAEEVGTGGEVTAVAIAITRMKR